MRHEREDDLIVSSSRSLPLRVIVTFSENMFKCVAKRYICAIINAIKW